MHFFLKIPSQERRLTLSTLITLIRIALTPIIVGAMIKDQWGFAFILFLIALLSDVLDGMLARYLHDQTILGACLDPIADKVLILSVFFTLAYTQSPLFTIPLWFVWLVLIKELLLLGGALCLFIFTGDVHIRPTVLGKTVMVVQSGFIVWLFACYFFAWVPIKTYYMVLGLVSVLVIATLLHYAYYGMRQLYNLVY